MGEYAVQLSQLQQHSAGIEKKIAEIELRLASLKKDLAVDQAIINAVKARMRIETYLSASLRHRLSELLSKHSEIKRRRKAA